MNSSCWTIPSCYRFSLRDSSFDRAGYGWHPKMPHFSLRLSPPSSSPSHSPPAHFSLDENCLLQRWDTCIDLKATGYFFLPQILHKWQTQSKINCLEICKNAFPMVPGRRDAYNVKRFTICHLNVVFLFFQETKWARAQKVPPLLYYFFNKILAKPFYRFSRLLTVP